MRLARSITQGCACQSVIRQYFYGYALTKRFCFIVVVGHVLVFSCGIRYTHLNIATPLAMQLVGQQPRWTKHRGVEQRNIALRWLVKNHGNIVQSGTDGVVYLMDDDNTYGLQLFDEVGPAQLVCACDCCSSVVVVWHRHIPSFLLRELGQHNWFGEGESVL